MFEKNLNIAYLLDFYGDILSERKKTVLDGYYNRDLSLAEIAEELGHFPPRVSAELIKKAENELCFYEEKLGLAEKFRRTESRIRHLISLAEDNRPVGEIRAELLFMEEELEK